VTERKPPGATWESWIERQIEDGRRDGAFDDLPGHGRPIEDLDRPHDELWWVKAKLQREEVLVTPPTIAIRTDRDTVLERAMAASDEAEVRRLIEQLNDRIREVNRSATWGPPSTVAPLDVEGIVERWRATAPPAATPTAPTEHVAPIVWWRRLLRRGPRIHPDP